MNWCEMNDIEISKTNDTCFVEPRRPSGGSRGQRHRWRKAHHQQTGGTHA